MAVPTAAAALLAVGVVSMALGRYPVPVGHVVEVLAGQLTGNAYPGPATEQDVVGHRRNRDEHGEMQEVGRQERQYALENPADGNVRRDAMHHIEIDADRRMHEADFHGAYEEDPEPDG